METHSTHPALLAAIALCIGLASAQALAGDKGKGHGNDQGQAQDRYPHDHDGHRDNGRRGPPPWARGHDYRSYGYGNVVIVGVPDYGRYRLYAPRPGYRWVRDDAGHYLLVSIASGIISDILTRSGL